MLNDRVLAGICLVLVAARVSADEAKFQPGEVVEYRVGSATPEKWERGKIIKPLEGGKQYLIHEKPSQFFPEGSERAYSPTELRRPIPAKPQPKPGDKPVAPPKRVPKPAASPDEAERDQELLSEEEVLAYARKVFGGADKEVNQAHPKRSEFSDQIRDYIKQRGTSFKASATSDFYNALNEQGTGSVHIVQAVNDNYGAHPKLSDYFGTFLLRSASRGSRSVRSDGSGTQTIVTEDAQAESGRLTIRKDGAYEWELLRGDPPAKWLRGKWREARPAEMMPTEGGPALWLVKAKGGDDYMVRMDREVGYTDWINVGAGKGRTPVEYGRRAK